MNPGNDSAAGVVFLNEPTSFLVVRYLHIPDHLVWDLHPQ